MSSYPYLRNTDSWCLLYEGKPIFFDIMAPGDGPTSNSMQTAQTGISRLATFYEIEMNLGVGQGGRRSKRKELRGGIREGYSKFHHLNFSKN